ncbi:MAG: hypothetical protein ACSHXK_13155 [Oceanococcus sp.]
MALHESFLTHRSSIWLKFAILLCALCGALYVWHDPLDGPNGGTWLGYTLGTIGAVLIIWLALLGARKRSYRSNMGTVKGWTSAHVWLGLSLIIVATLHSGFQFGWNIHTFAWALMVLVIASGLWGVVAYVRYPDKITAAKNSMVAEDMVREIAELDQQMLSIASGLGKETHERTLRSLNRTQIGGGFWQQVAGVEISGGFAEGLAGRLREELEKSALSRAPKMQKNEDAEEQGKKVNATFMFVAADFVSAEQNEKQRDNRRKLLDLLSRKKALVTNLNADITRRARMSLWLYFHVPLTIALIASLIVHVISVFLYW